MIETDRLRLRRWEPRDLAPFAALNADPEVMALMPRRLDRAASDDLVARIDARWREDGIGFAVAVLLSIWVATPRIAIASCSAFIVAQLLDITVFDRLRRGSWWRAPMVATTCSATVDTTLFWSIAFAGSTLPWVSWAAGDLAVKLAIGVCLLAPFRALLWKMAPLRATS